MLKNRALNLSQTAFLYRFWLVKNHGLKILFRVVQYLWKSLYSRTGDSKLTVEMAEEMGTVLLYLFLLHLLYALGVL